MLAAIGKEQTAMSSERAQLQEIDRRVGIYFKIRKFVAAEELLNNAIERYPQAANLNLLLGLCFQKQSQYDKAIREFMIALNKNNEYLEAALNLSLTLSDLGQYQEAEDVYKKAIVQFKGRSSLPKPLRGKLANSHAANGIAYRRLGLAQEAATEFRKALALYERMPDIKIELAKIYMETGQSAKSKKELLEVKAMAPANHEALALLGVLMFHSGEVDGARDFLVKASRLNPNNNLARAYLKICNPADQPNK